MVLEDIHAFTARCDAQLVTPSTDGMRAIVASFAAVLAAYSDLRVEFSKVVEVSRVRGEQAMCTCPAAGAGQVTTGASGLDAPSVTSPAGITSPALVALPTPTAATAAAAASGGGDGGGITILPGLTNAAAAHVGLDDGSTVAQLRMTAAPSTSARAAPPTSAAEAQPPSSAAEAQLPPSAAEGQLPPFAVKAQPQALAAVPQLLSLPHLAPSLSITPVVRVLSCSPLCVPTHGGGFKPLSPLEVEAERCNLQRAIDEGARIAQWRGRSLLCTPKLECAYLTEATMREAFRKVSNRTER